MQEFCYYTDNAGGGVIPFNQYSRMDIVDWVQHRKTQHTF